MLLVYDGDCGFCTASARWIDKRLPDEVAVVAWQQLDLDQFALTERQVSAAAYFVDDVGSLHRGHDAVGRALVATGGAWAPLGRSFLIPPGSWLARPAYALVARFRHRLPGRR